MAKRRMSAKQRRYFGRRARSAVRSVRRTSRRAYSNVRSYRRSGGSRSSWLPLSMREHASAAITGVSAPLVTYGVKKMLPDSWLAPLGDYSDEVALYGAAALAHKFAPNGFLKELARDHARVAVMSASSQAISPMVSKALGITGTPSLGGSLAAIGYI